MPAHRTPHRIVTILLAASFAVGPVFAEKPEWAGGGKGGDKHGEKHGGKHADKFEGKHADKHDGKHGGKHTDWDEDRRGRNVARDDGPGPRGGKPARAQPRGEVRAGAFFTDQNRYAARSYYAQQYGGGKACPPGLAKKNNGCMPPGQAKKWAIGQPLPAGVVVYSVPQPVLLQLPPAPVGYKYVRVASDILLIAIGSQMVMDGISDLMRL